MGGCAAAVSSSHEQQRARGVIAAAVSVCLEQRSGVIATVLSVCRVRWHVHLDVAAMFMCRKGVLSVVTSPVYPSAVEGSTDVSVPRLPRLRSDILFL